MQKFLDAYISDTSKLHVLVASFHLVHRSAPQLRSDEQLLTVNAAVTNQGDLSHFTGTSNKTLLEVPVKWLKSPCDQRFQQKNELQRYQFRQRRLIKQHARGVAIVATEI